MDLFGGGELPDNLKDAMEEIRKKLVEYTYSPELASVMEIKLVDIPCLPNIFKGFVVGDDMDYLRNVALKNDSDATLAQFLSVIVEVQETFHPQNLMFFGMVIMHVWNSSGKDKDTFNKLMGGIENGSGSESPGCEGESEAGT